MKSIWKWILGIVIVLVVVAGLVGLGFVMYNRMSAVAVQRTVPNSQMWRGPMHGRGPGERIPPRIMPMMRERGFGFGHFGPGFMFLGLLGRLVPVALLALLLYGAYRLGKRNLPVSAAPAPAPPPVAATRACPKCQTPVQDGWKHCPNCGEAQAN